MRNTKKVFSTSPLILVSLPLVAGFALLMASCYPGDPLSTGELDLVATLFDPNADFSTKRTYAMPDSVVHVADSTETPADIDRQYDDLILSEIAQNLQQLGYTRVADPVAGNPDVLVIPYVTTTRYVGYIGGGWYWGWWYPYPPGYGWWYPWYPPYYGGTAYTYQTGTLLVDMFDPDKADAQEKKIPSIWVAAINGLAQGSSAEISTRLTNTIEQAFTQSSYLGAGK